MATLTITLGPHTFSKTISAPHIARLLVAYRALYGQIQDGTNPDGSPIMRDRTDAEVAASVASGLFAGMKANVLGHERGAAGKTASDAIADVVMT